MAAKVEQPGLLHMTGRALRLRCPVCGSGGLFRRWVTMAERCPRCGLRFERGEGEFIGAIGVNTVVTFALLMVYTVVAAVFIAQGESVAGFVIGALVIAVGFPVVFHPFSHTIWLTIGLAMDPLEEGEAPGLVPTEGP